MPAREIGQYQINPILSGMAAGINWDQKFIAEEVLPVVDVGGEIFNYPKYGNEGLEDVDLERGINEDQKEVDVTQGFSDDVKLIEYSAVSKIDKRLIHAARQQDRLRTIPAKMSAVERLHWGRTRRMHYNVQIAKEKRAAQLFFTAANFEDDYQIDDLDFGAVGVLKELKRLIRTCGKAFGHRPNTFVLGDSSEEALVNSSDFMDRITGGATSKDPAEVTLEMICRMLEIKVAKVGTAVSQTKADPGEHGTVTELWSPTKAALVYIDYDNTDDCESPTFGRMATMNVPETSVRVQVGDWWSPNGKINFVDYTEFAKIFQQMKCGIYFENTNPTP